MTWRNAGRRMGLEVVWGSTASGMAGIRVWLGSKSITNEEIRSMTRWDTMWYDRIRWDMIGHRWLLDERGEPVVLRVPCRRERTYVHTLNYRYIHLVLWVPEVTASRRYFPTVPYGVGNKYAVGASTSSSIPPLHPRFLVLLAHPRRSGAVTCV